MVVNVGYVTLLFIYFVSIFLNFVNLEHPDGGGSLFNV